MNDSTRTLAFIGGAVVLCGVAMLTTPGSMPPPEQFSDVGEAFYPEFADPLEAAGLEVIAYDDDSGTATPFKVAVKDGVWSIPSHYDYPADGEDRLAKTAAGIIDIKKDAVQSDRIEDHETLGVIDPLDDTLTTLTGRGQRVRVLSDSGGILADFIIGKEAEGANRTGYRYVRLPDKKRTYAVKIDVDISTRFSDWIETNLLKLTSTTVERLNVLDYSVDETTGRVDMRDQLQLDKRDNDWTLPELADNEEVNQSTVRGIPTALSNIRITGVRPKPPGLTADLKTDDALRLNIGAQLSLNSKGFFVSQNGQLLSNEGELDVGTNEGIRYTLRFGEIIYGEGLDISAGSEEQDADSGSDDAAPAAGGVENRYLFVTAALDETLLGDKPAPPDGYVPTDQLDAEADTAQDAPDAQEGAANGGAGEDEAATPAADADASGTDEDEAKKAREEARRLAESYERELEAWNSKVEAGRESTAELNARFAPWYYVISGKDFSRIHVDRTQVVQDKATE